MASYETSPSGNTDSIFVDVPVINIKGWIGSGTPRRHCRVCIPFPFARTLRSSALFPAISDVRHRPRRRASIHPEIRTHVRSNALNIANR